MVQKITDEYMSVQEIRKKCPEHLLDDFLDWGTDGYGKIPYPSKDWEKIWKEFEEYLVDREEELAKMKLCKAQEQADAVRAAKSQKLSPTKAATQTTLFGDRSSSSASAKVVTFKNGNFQMQMC